MYKSALTESGLVLNFWHSDKNAGHEILKKITNTEKRMQYNEKRMKKPNQNTVLCFNVQWHTGLLNLRFPSSLLLWQLRISNTTQLYEFLFVHISCLFTKNKPASGARKLSWLNEENFTSWFYTFGHFSLLVG